MGACGDNRGPTASPKLRSIDARGLGSTTGGFCDVSEGVKSHKYRLANRAVVAPESGVCRPKSSAGAPKRSVCVFRTHVRPPKFSRTRPHVTTVTSRRYSSAAEITRGSRGPARSTQGELPGAPCFRGVEPEGGGRCAPRGNRGPLRPSCDQLRGRYVAPTTTSALATLWVKEKQAV